MTVDTSLLPLAVGSAMVAMAVGWATVRTIWVRRHATRLSARTSTTRTAARALQVPDRWDRDDKAVQRAVAAVRTGRQAARQAERAVADLWVARYPWRVRQLRQAGTRRRQAAAAVTAAIDAVEVAAGLLADTQAAWDDATGWAAALPGQVEQAQAAVAFARSRGIATTDLADRVADLAGLAELARDHLAAGRVRDGVTATGHAAEGLAVVTGQATAAPDRFAAILARRDAARDAVAARAAADPDGARAATAALAAASRQLGTTQRRMDAAEAALDTLEAVLAGRPAGS